MSGTGGGSGGGTGGGGSGTGGAAPAAGTGAPAAGTGAPAPGGEAPGGRLSLADGTRLLGERRRQAAAQAAPGGQPAPAVAPGQEAPAAKPPPGPRRRAAPNSTNGATAPGVGNGAAAPASGANGAAPVATGDATLDGLAALLAGGGTPPGTDGGTPGAATGDGDQGVALEIEGKQLRLSAADLKNHVERSLDYTRKTQELSDFARQVNDQRAELAAILPLVMPEIQRQIQQLQGVKPPSKELARTDPGRYNIERAEYDAAQDEAARLRQLEHVQTQQQAQQAQQQIDAGHRALVEKFPFWSDPAQRTQMQGELAKWGLANGYSRAELRGLSDPRHIVTMMKGMLFDRMMTRSTTAARPPATQDAAPARGMSQPQPRQVASADASAAEQRFQDKPDIRSGAALLSARRRTVN